MKVGLACNSKGRTTTVEELEPNNTKDTSSKGKGKGKGNKRSTGSSPSVSHKRSAAASTGSASHSSTEESEARRSSSEAWAAGRGSVGPGGPSAPSSRSTAVAPAKGPTVTRVAESRSAGEHGARPERFAVTYMVPSSNWEPLTLLPTYLPSLQSTSM
jgi:hypothetical protein